MGMPVTATHLRHEYWANPRIAFKYSLASLGGYYLHILQFESRIQAF